MSGDHNMNTDKTGGPAFPRPFSADDVDSDISYPAHTGMTLRDYFAAKAAQGLLANHEWNLDDKTAARMAYTVADAMLKARDE